MSPRSIFGECQKTRKASGEAGTSQVDVTIVTEDEESNAHFVAPRSPSSSGEKEREVLTFALPKDYSGTGSEVEVLTQGLLYWQGLQSHRPKGEMGYDDPARGILIA